MKAINVNALQKTNPKYKNNQRMWQNFFQLQSVLCSYTGQPYGTSYVCLNFFTFTQLHLLWTQYLISANRLPIKVSKFYNERNSKPCKWCIYNFRGPIYKILAGSCYLLSEAIQISLLTVSLYQAFTRSLADLGFAITMSGWKPSPKIPVTFLMRSGAILHSPRNTR